VSNQLVQVATSDFIVHSGMRQVPVGEPNVRTSRLGQNVFMSDAATTRGDWVGRQRAQAAGFDAIGARYDAVFPHKDGQIRAGELLLDRLPAGARVLDVGCGTGLPTARQLVAAGCEVTGIDISPVMLELARGNVPEATFVHCDAVDIDASLGRFHAVVAFFSLLMLPRNEIVRTLARLRAVLLPAGCLAIGMVEADLDDVALPFLGAPLRVTGWPREQLRLVIGDAGFTVDVEDTRSYVPPAPDAPPEVQLFLIAHRD
jgi:ubiquinone/menaquinone biosynthesis C-methylase UbiE